MTAPRLAPGAIVAGKYAVQSLLHHAGSIATYHAITAPSREVALKLYDPALKSFPDVMKTLANYQAIASSLPPISIVPVLDSGEDSETGAPYSATSFEAKPSLAQLVELCPLSANEMVILVESVARGLDLLHTHGIVHLSLHPSNVFVGPAPAFETRLADFGTSLVRRVLPVSDAQLGWMPWLAPEQIDDRAAPGPAADLFALALIAFFAVTGKSAWRSCASGAPDPAAWKREMTGPRVAVSQRAKDLSVSLGPMFDGAFARALATSPKDRFATAAQFASALKAAASIHANVSAGAPALPPPLPKNRSTMIGIGSGPAGDVPRPPPQIEAVLATFEAPAIEKPLAAGAAADIDVAVDARDAHVSVASADVHAAVAAETQEAIEIAGFDTVHPSRRSGIRRRLGIALGVAVLFGALLLIGKMASQKGRAVPAAASGTIATDSPEQGLRKVPTDTAESAGPLGMAAPESPHVTTPEPLSAGEVNAEPAIVQPPREPSAPRPPRPAWRRKPASPTPSAPAKKPCGKFLKRCN